MVIFHGDWEIKYRGCSAFQIQDHDRSPCRTTTPMVESCPDTNCGNCGNVAHMDDGTELYTLRGMDSTVVGTGIGQACTGGGAWIEHWCGTIDGRSKRGREQG